VVGAGVLRGAADTTFPAACALVGYWALALPTGWYLAFHAGLGTRGFWWGFTVGLGTVALLLLLRIAARFRHGEAGDRLLAAARIANRQQEVEEGEIG
jgi:Na+-driven multidrug efflux pump